MDEDIPEEAMTESLIVRAATQADRARVLQISSQIWDGEDYVPELLDDWYADAAGEFVVAALDGEVIGFAHRTWLYAGLAWFEGIRTDPAFQGRGAGRAITDHLIATATRDGAQQIVLSTHIDNKASIHILESYGFKRQASFFFLERASNAPIVAAKVGAPGIEALSADEFRGFVATSPALDLGARWFSRGWKFFPFDLDPQEAVARLEYRIGLRNNDELAAVLAIRQPQGGPWITINFLDGDPDLLSKLISHALADYRGSSLGVMVPVRDEVSAAALEPLKAAGFTSWTGFVPDVFVYTLDLSRKSSG